MEGRRPAVTTAGQCRSCAAGRSPAPARAAAAPRSPRRCAPASARPSCCSSPSTLCQGAGRYSASGRHVAAPGRCACSLQRGIVVWSDSRGPKGPRHRRPCVTSMGPTTCIWNERVIASGVAASTLADSRTPELFTTMSTCGTDSAGCSDQACERRRRRTAERSARGRRIPQTPSLDACTSPGSRSAPQRSVARQRQRAG